MSEIPWMLGSALVAGAAHVLFGADHLAALAPFAIEARGQAWVVGLRWGVGHALGIVVVGLAGVTLFDWLGVGLSAGLGRLVVGCMLVAIGVWGLVHARSTRLRTADPLRAPAHVHTGAAFLVGGVHGVAGTGNLLGILPAVAQSSWQLGSGYLAGFAAGTILATLGVARLLGLAGGSRAARAEGLYRGFFVGASVLSLALGVFLVTVLALGAVFP